MVYVGSVGLGIPSNEIHQEDVKKLVANDLFAKNRKIKRLLPVFDNAFVKKRQIVVDMEWFKEEHHLAETNDLYLKHAKSLSLEAIDRCLRKIKGKKDSYNEIDMIIFVSSTGIATPSLDTYILNERPFREDVIRMPLWGLGCAGGAMGLSRAFEWLQLFKQKTVLLVCCELCSLTFQKGDMSTSNIVGTALFGDGVAATLLIGENSVMAGRLPKKRLKVKRNHSMIKENSTDVMGWRVTERGFEVIFSKQIPKLIPTLWKKHLHHFLQKEGLTANEVTMFIAHPGGRKVLEEMEKIQGIGSEKLNYSYTILQQHGNMSSATVLYVLERWMDSKKDDSEKEALGVVSALGPGFSSELLLMEWVNG